MIRKIALTHALRECFPQVYSGLYDESESGFMETANQTPQATKQTQPTQQIKQVETIEEF